jgi:hypothetical protein
MPRQMIRWSVDELTLLAEQAAKIRLERGFGELDCWRQAQTILPTNRRRKISQLKAIVEPAREVYKIKLRELQQAPEPVVIEQPEVQPEVIEQPELSELPTPSSSIIDDLLEAFADAIADKFAEAFKRSLIQKIREAAPDITEPFFKEPLKPRRVRRSILIVGLLPAQSEIIKRRFEDRLDLRFVSSQETPQTISTRVGDAEKILLMTNFIQHSHQQAAIQLKGRENVVLVSGGISTLTKQLGTL